MTKAQILTHMKKSCRYEYDILCDVEKKYGGDNRKTATQLARWGAIYRLIEEMFPDEIENW